MTLPFGGPTLIIKFKRLCRSLTELPEGRNLSLSHKISILNNFFGKVPPHLHSGGLFDLIYM